MLPSCEASAPMPSPASSIGQVTISGPAPASSAPIITTSPANSARKPSWTTLRGEALREQLRDADRGEQQGDRERQQANAGFDRRQPERDGQEQRNREEHARLQQVLEEERRQPAAQRRVA